MIKFIKRHVARLKEDDVTLIPLWMIVIEEIVKRTWRIIIWPAHYAFWMHVLKERGLKHMESPLELYSTLISFELGKRHYRKKFVDLNIPLNVLFVRFGNNQIRRMKRMLDHEHVIALMKRLQSIKSYREFNAAQRAYNQLIENENDGNRNKEAKASCVHGADS